MRYTYKHSIDVTMTLIEEEQTYLAPLEREIEELRKMPKNTETIARYTYLTHKVSSGMAYIDRQTGFLAAMDRIFKEIGLTQLNVDAAQALSERTHP